MLININICLFDYTAKNVISFEYDLNRVLHCNFHQHYYFLGSEQKVDVYEYINN